jgi:Fur family transcriptional regulator, ferric uptake regulator
VARRARISAAMVALMQEGERHAWTLEELHAGLAQRGQENNFSSVFRAAEKLTTNGVTLKLLLEDGRARFELASVHHDHLFCTRCGDLAPVPRVLGTEDFAAIERATGAAVLEYHLILNGICRKCQSATELGRKGP